MSSSTTSDSLAAGLLDVTMPQMGVSVAEGTIVEWKVAVGDEITAEATICEISTDKIDTEVPAPAGGTVTEILVAVGETVEVGTVLARLDTGSEGGSSAAPAPAAAAPAPARAAAPAPAPVAALAPAAAPAPTSGIIGIAASLSGIPYVYGGTTTSGFDCSGFTGYVYARAGKSIPRVAEAQRAASTKVSNPVPGDLIFFGFPAYHVGIYAGDGKLYDAQRTGTFTGLHVIWTQTNVSYGRF
ncbi:MAG: NlpC/P60 family protein [Actinomycetota bacterium]|nr:NlpC/P60 family protein [Actinomycetota bacterium]